MNEGTTVVIFLVGFVLVALLMVAGLVGIGVLIFRIMSGTRQTLVGIQPNQPVERGEEFLNAAELRPWTDDAWTDLSSRWEGWWRNITHVGRQDGYAQGVVRSLRDPVGPGWIAFTSQRQQMRNGVVVLRTSDRRVDLRVSANSLTDPNVHVDAWLDGTMAGSITVTYPSCVLRSADGAIEAHWTAELRWNKEFRVLDRVISRDLTYDALHVNGRQIATLIDTWIRYPHPSSDKPIPPAFQSVAGDLTDADRGVLLVAIAMGLYYDTLRKQLRTRNDVIYDW